MQMKLSQNEKLVLQLSIQNQELARRLHRFELGLHVLTFIYSGVDQLPHLALAQEVPNLCGPIGALWAVWELTGVCCGYQSDLG